MKNILLVIILLAFGLQAQTRWWVKVGGNNSNTGKTSTQALATLAAAADSMSGGDWLIVDGSGGAFDLSGGTVGFNTSSLDGTLTQPTRIIGVNGASITAGTPGTTYVVLNVNADHILFDNIIFDGARGGATYGSQYIYVQIEDQDVIGETRRMTFRNCTFKDNAAIVQNEDDTRYIQNIHIEYCTFVNNRIAITLETANYRESLGSYVRIINSSFYGDAHSSSYVYKSESSSNSGLGEFSRNIVQNFNKVFRTHVSTWMNDATADSTIHKYNIYHDYTTFDDESTNISLAPSESTVDPLFLSPSTDDLRLQATSPARGFAPQNTTIGSKKRSAINASY